MDKTPHIQQLLIELGAAVPTIDTVIRGGQATWGLAFDDGLIFTLDLLADGTKLVLGAELGTVPEAGRPAFHEKGMAYNALWRETGGLRLAAVDGEAMLFYDLQTEALDLETLSAAVLNFATKCRFWQGQVGKAGDTSAMQRPADAMAFAVRA